MRERFLESFQLGKNKDSQQKCELKAAGAEVKTEAKSSQKFRYRKIKKLELRNYRQLEQKNWNRVPGRKNNKET